MTRITIVFICLLLCFTVAESSAEVCQGIKPYMKLEHVKKKFPRATYKKVFPVWLEEQNAAYEVAGLGISGKIIIFFHDYRPWNQMMMERATDNVSKSFWKPLVAQSDDKALVVSWIIWIPVAPFPAERLITTYGKPTRKDYTKDDAMPFMMWESRGVLAYLTDDGKKILGIECTFTPKEMEDAWDAILKHYKEKKVRKRGKG